MKISLLNLLQSVDTPTVCNAIEIASGEAEIYLTTTNKMKQWDTCASNCIISEAGGKMTDISGKEMVYNTESVNHENGILVTNGSVHQDALDAVSRLDS